jgi:hypothetical protein
MAIMGYLVHLFIYWNLLAFLLAIPVVLLIEFLPQDLLGGGFGIVLFFLLAACGLAAGWVAHLAALRRVFEDDAFVEALHGAVQDARLYFLFVPIIGRWMTSRTSTPGDESTSSDDRIPPTS